VIIVKLMGGLGNQLFQYAAGTALAEKHGTILKLDLTFLETDAGLAHTQRRLELDGFNTRYEICTKADLERFKNPGLIKGLLSRYLPANWFDYRVANEKSFAYDPGFDRYPKNTYLNGFWQSEKYFHSICGLLIRELVLKQAIPPAVMEVASAITASNSLSLHIRRGDYVTNKNAQQFHGLLPLDYYYSALRHITAVAGEPKVFVFSDDIPWAKANLQVGDNAVFVNTGHSGTDLYLMSLCRHHIIANSSFSWWGAWLSQHAGKQVVAPKQWFAQPDINTADLIPIGWTRL
jgi:hypothetical protein